mgnify:CR=1 FL=1
MLDYLLKFLKKQHFISDVKLITYDRFGKKQYAITATLKYTKKTFDVNSDQWYNDVGIKKYNNFSKTDKIRFNKNNKRQLEEFFKNDEYIKKEIRLCKLNDII